MIALFRQTWKRWAGLTIAAGALLLCQGPAARAEGSPSFDFTRFIVLRPNIEIDSSLSAPYYDLATGSYQRTLYFSVYNTGPVACGPNTTMVQVEVGDPSSPIGTAIWLQPFPNAGLGWGGGAVYALKVPDAKYIRIDLWADYYNNVVESDEGDNHRWHVRPFLIVPWVIWP
jgi:hypothetical protein